jgi:hypothetical protein
VWWGSVCHVASVIRFVLVPRLNTIVMPRGLLLVCQYILASSRALQDIPSCYMNGFKWATRGLPCGALGRRYRSGFTTHRGLAGALGATICLTSSHRLLLYRPRKALKSPTSSRPIKDRGGDQIDLPSFGSVCGHFGCPARCASSSLKDVEAFCKVGPKCWGDRIYAVELISAFSALHAIRRSEFQRGRGSTREEGRSAPA